jgi:ribonuclease HI
MKIFTDGSTINNGKKNAIGGIGIYIPKQGEIEEWSLSYSLISAQDCSIKVTNQISELIAIILGIEKAIKLTKDTIYVYTDSKYSIECATTWSKSWIKNNWKKSTGKVIENLWLIYRLVQLTQKHPIIPIQNLLGVMEEQMLNLKIIILKIIY